MGGNPGSRPRVRHLHAPFAMSHARLSVLMMRGFRNLLIHSSNPALNLLRSD